MIGGVEDTGFSIILLSKKANGNKWTETQAADSENDIILMYTKRRCCKGNL